MNSPQKKETNPKDALGCKKPPLSTLPVGPLFEAAAGMLEGACKYGRHNYRDSGVRVSVYYDAALRHLMAWWEGEDIDPDSGLHHVSKAIASLLVLRDAQMNGMVSDDRPPSSKPGWMTDAQANVDAVLQRYPEPVAPHTIETSKGPLDRADSQIALEAARRLLADSDQDSLQDEGR